MHWSFSFAKYESVDRISRLTVICSIIKLDSACKDVRPILNERRGCVLQRYELASSVSFINVLLYDGTSLTHRIARRESVVLSAPNGDRSHHWMEDSCKGNFQF